MDLKMERWRKEETKRVEIHITEIEVLLYCVFVLPAEHATKTVTFHPLHCRKLYLSCLGIFNDFSLIPKNKRCWRLTSWTNSIWSSSEIHCNHSSMVEKEEIWYPFRKRLENRVCCLSMLLLRKTYSCLWSLFQSVFTENSRSVRGQICHEWSFLSERQLPIMPTESHKYSFMIRRIQRTWRS